MKTGLLSVFCALVVLPWSSAYAIDCTKASVEVDKLICATPELTKADDEMSAAYLKLLHETVDPDFHQNLIQSQLRWLEQRGHGPDQFGLAKDYDKTDDRKVLIEMTRARQQFLQSGEPIRTMEKQRATISKDGGGAFAGYRLSCSFMPPPYGDWRYSCRGATYRRHKDRVCGASTSWASGRIYDLRFVGAVKNDELELLATCSTNYGSTTEPCPGVIGKEGYGADAHWNTAPKPSSYEWLPLPTETLWKYDPDRSEGDDAMNGAWMDECLFSAAYPPADASRADTYPPPGAIRTDK